jgi:3-hydroxy-9,10-secoandrosta-1,3,5(10)-triene-9,17-dione monooxygenase
MNSAAIVDAVAGRSGPARRHDSLTEDELLRRLRGMLPALRERASEAERLRKLPQSTIDDAKKSGYLSAFRTRYFGGPGLGLSALANGARILAQGCGSSAWTLVFLAQHTWMFAKAPLALQQELLGGDFPAMMAGALARVGEAEPVKDGYLVTARSEWNSGIMHAGWVNMKAKIDGVDHLVALPVESVTVEDVWYTAGMRATGSNTVVATKAFAPKHRVAPTQVMLGSKAHPVHDDEPFASYPFVPLAMMTMSAVSLGIAEGAVDEFKSSIGKRIIAFTGGARQVEQPAAHLRLGEVIATLRAAQSLWHETLDKIIDTYESRRELGVEGRVGIRQAATFVTKLAAEIVREVTASSGGSCYFESSPLQRMQRDVEVLKSHASLDWDRASQMAGRIALNLPLAPTDLF